VVTNASVLILLWWNFLNGPKMGQMRQSAEGLCGE
jgi:hypothetical protein